MNTKDKTMSDEVVIDVRNVSKCYHLYDRPQDRLLQSIFRGRRKFYRDFWALTDVSLQVRRGESVGIIGRNGAGKSTLLQLIAGTLTPTSGEVEIRGRVAALLQLGSGFNPEFSGRENVFLNGAILGFSRLEMNRFFDEIAAFANIGEFMEQPVKTYSSGMSMRLAFAVSVCLEPEVLIVDEALSVGDSAFQFKCRERLQRLINRGSTLLFVSHDTSAIKAFCDRAIYLGGGKLLAEGTPDNIVDVYNHHINEEKLGSRHQYERETTTNPPNISEETAHQSSIRKLHFENSSNESLVFRRGENIAIIATCHLDKKLVNPELAIIIKTKNQLMIAGHTAQLQKEKIGQTISVKYEFPAILRGYKFFISANLVDRISDKDSITVARATPTLVFEIVEDIKTATGSMGYFDLGFKVEITDINNG